MVVVTAAMPPRCLQVTTASKTTPPRSGSAYFRFLLQMLGTSCFRGATCGGPQHAQVMIGHKKPRTAPPSRVNTARALRIWGPTAASFRFGGLGPRG